MNNQELLARDQQGWTLNAEEYKRECTAHNVQPMHYTDCRGVLMDPPDGLFVGGLNNTVTLSGDGERPWITKMLLGRANGRDVLAFEARQRAARQATPQPAPETIVCQACGGRISRTMAMTSARGTVCPDCYDQSSN